MIFKYFLTFCFLVINSYFIFSQADSIQKKDTIKDKHIRNAVLLSSIIPGAGQVYNHIRMPKGSKKAFWKVPLFYAALGTTGYYFIKNQTLKNAYKKEYISRENGNAPNIGFEEYDSYSLLNLHEQYENRRNLFLIGFIFSYLLQVTDAAVEAHFVNYDLSPDLSIKIIPDFFYSDLKPQYSCSIKLTYQIDNFNLKKKKIVSLFEFNKSNTIN